MSEVARWWKEKKEAELINSLSHFAQGKDPFEISLSGFSAFAPRVIFAAVIENEKLKQLQTELVRCCRQELNLFNAQYQDKPFHPHITLAFRDLKKSLFVEAWNEFQHKAFSGSFIVNGVDLLKHDGHMWQRLHFFHF